MRRVFRGASSSFLGKGSQASPALMLPRWSSSSAKLSGNARKTISKEDNGEFCEKTPLAGIHKTAIQSTLVAAGLPPLNAPDMADPVWSYIAGYKFREIEEWPTCHAPPTVKGSGLSFVTTKAGRWCFDASEPYRMVRLGEYPQLWNELKAAICGHERRGMLVTGHPGIGKTLLLDLVLSWCLHDFPDIPVVTVDVTGVSLFTNKVGGSPKCFKYPKDARTLPSLLFALGHEKGGKVIILHDLKMPTTLSYNGALVNILGDDFSIRCVVSATPECNYKDFKKDMTAPSYFLPILSKEEVKLLCKHKLGTSFSEEEFEDRFVKVGGVARHHRSTYAVDDAVHMQHIAARKITLGPGFEPTAGTTGSHSSALLAPVPDASRTRIAGLQFVSANAQRQWVQAQDVDSISRQLRHLRKHRADEGSRVLEARLFKDWIMSLLAKHTKQAKLCRAQVAPHSGPLEVWDRPKLVPKYFNGNDASVIKPAKDDTLYVALSDDFPVVDAAIVTKGGKATLIHVTINDDHPLPSKEVQGLFDTLAANNVEVEAFVWVVDGGSKLNGKQPLRDREAKVPAYDAVPHYICRHDAKMCWVLENGMPSEASVGFPVDDHHDPSEADLLKTTATKVDAKGRLKFLYYKGAIGALDNPLTYESAEDPANKATSKKGGRRWQEECLPKRF